MKTRYGRKVYENNPFIKDLNKKLIIQDKTITSNLTATDNNDNTLTGVITNTIKTKSLNYIQVTDDWINCMLDFTSNGNVAAWVTLLFMYEINHKAISKDYVFLPYDRIVELSNALDKPVPSRSTFSRGTGKMYDKNIIANHFYGVGWYWFNPYMMFNGNIGRIL